MKQKTVYDFHWLKKKRLGTRETFFNSITELMKTNNRAFQNDIKSLKNVFVIFISNLCINYSICKLRLSVSLENIVFTTVLKITSFHKGMYQHVFSEIKSQFQPKGTERPLVNQKFSNNL